MTHAPASRGPLILVVGPSGAGKDTLIAGAQAALAGSPHVRFARREIAPPQAERDEPHVPVSVEAFEAKRLAGEYALSWTAHGLRYGLPMAALEPLEQGCAVVANASRSVIEEARTRFAPVRVVLVRAPLEALAQRLRARGRESEPEIAERLARAEAFRLEGPDVIPLDNDVGKAEATARLVAVLTRLAPSPPEGG